MIKIDDKGEGAMANYDVSKNCKISGRFLGISSYFKNKILVIFESFLKINNNRRKIFKYVTE